MAIFLGRFFDAFADFATGKIPPETLTERTLKSVYALVAVGAGTLLLKGGLFAAWLSFGEMQAKGVRDELFQALLEKDLPWFEMREAGVGTLLARLQRCHPLQVQFSTLPADPMSARFESCNSVPRNLWALLYKSWLKALWPSASHCTMAGN
jgi:ATP-binding cassette subfamily B (MDR/TAP) protein 1